MTQAWFVGTLVLVGATCGMASAATLDDVRVREKLVCGVSTNAPGFAQPDANEIWQGFDIALCRSVAAAVLGDGTAVEVVVPEPGARFDALARGDLDLLVRNTSWTFGNDVTGGLTVAGISYYDGQGFLVPRDLPVTSAKDLDRRRVCVPQDASLQESLVDYFETNNMSNEVVEVASSAEAQQRYLEGECEVVTGYRSELAAMRASFENAGQHVLLPETISKEPLGPLVREGDDDWADIVRWTLFALIAAEEFGVTSANVADMAAKEGDSPGVNRLLGTSGDFGAALGLEADWAQKAIGVSGNYGEIFEKNIGQNTPIGLVRGLNAQWIDGGLLYAPPFR